MIERETTILLYGKGGEPEKLVLRLISGSDKLVALVNCEELQEGHRQIAVNRPLGRSTPESVEGLGFLPDLIVARCCASEQAAGLVEWTELGPKLICMFAPRAASEHGRWSALDGFGLQVFCGDDGTFLAHRRAAGQA
jgi:hypothetical protein